MKTALSLALLLASSFSGACIPAQPRVVGQGPTGTGGTILAVSAGTFSTGGGVVDGTYVIDPAAKLCFFSAHVVQGGSTGPAGLTVIDCCHLRYIPQVQTALPELTDATCGPAPIATPAVAPAAPAPPTAP